MTNRNLKQTIFLALGFLAFSQIAEAVVPAPDGGYPGGNTAEGQNSLFTLTSGGYNTGVGFFSLRSNTTGSFNTAVGAGTLLNNTGDQNTATGVAALLSNTDGTGNTGNGVFALFNNTTGGGNTAVGWLALFSNTSAGSADQGTGNTAIGYRALDSNTTGERNTAVGTGALDQNITGDRNTATGRGALGGNAIGVQNTADGQDALFSNTGSYNTASGDLAFFSKTTGDFNIALGESAGCNLMTGDNNIYIGSAGVAAESNTIRIGTMVAAMNCAGVEQSVHTATYVAGIFGAATMGGVPVYIDATGKLGTQTSSRRFKRAIQPMNKASEAILALKPVTFQYGSDQTNTPQFGLVAEEVAAVNPDLVVRDRNGEIYTVRYDAVNAMLLNEFLKEHNKVQNLEATVTRQQKQIEALASGLGKVSAQVGLIKSRPQLALK